MPVVFLNPITIIYQCVTKTSLSGRKHYIRDQCPFEVRELWMDRLPCHCCVTLGKWVSLSELLILHVNIEGGGPFLLGSRWKLNYSVYFHTWRSLNSCWYSRSKSNLHELIDVSYNILTKTKQPCICPRFVITSVQTTPPFTELHFRVAMSTHVVVSYWSRKSVAFQTPRPLLRPCTLILPNNTKDHCCQWPSWEFPGCFHTIVIFLFS